MKKISLMILVLTLVLTGCNMGGISDVDTTQAPTMAPTEAPTMAPTESPTMAPTEAPTEVPTEAPTIAPTEAPTMAPTEVPIIAPTEASTIAPTEAPTMAPTEVPTIAPTEAPTIAPTEVPTVAPTEAPTQEPTEAPTVAPTETPTIAPTEAPTVAPTETPTIAPTEAPTIAPTEAPTIAPTEAPTEEPPMKQIVAQDTEETSTTSDYKYGVKKVTTTVDYYWLYSDGSKEAYDSYTYDTYDTSGYTATDAELLEESNSTSAANMQYYNEVLALVNEIRAEAGVHPLTLDATLCQAATMRSLEMNYSQSFSHTRPDGSSCFSALDTYSISYCAAGENIAFGYPTPADVVEGWKNSSGHYANMIDASFNKIGVGMSDLEISSGIYWTQLFTD